MKGKRAGAYKDTDGILHIADITCTHLGYEMEFRGENMGLRMSWITFLLLRRSCRWAGCKAFKKNEKGVLSK